MEGPTISVIIYTDNMQGCSVMNDLDKLLTTQYQSRLMINYGMIWDKCHEYVVELFREWIEGMIDTSPVDPILLYWWSHDEGPVRKTFC